MVIDKAADLADGRCPEYHDLGIRENRPRRQLLGFAQCTRRGSRRWLRVQGHRMAEPFVPD